MATDVHSSSSSSSSSPSSSSSSEQYDVFVSFRGEDTRKNFTSHLATALVKNGVRTFVDKKLHTGEEIGPGLFTAIEESRISIPILSKNYAASKWCLQELAKILQCRKNNNQIVLPIFYNVEPSDVSKTTGNFQKALRKYEMEFNPEIVKEWRTALTKVGKLKGWDLKAVDNGDESKLIELVVQRVLSEVDNPTLSVAKHPVGLDSHVDRLLLLLNLKSPNVQFVGICGIGGIGKTTMAKALYNEIFKKFEGNSFLADVSEKGSRSNGLACLQKQLVNDVLKENVDISSVHKGSCLIKEKLKRKKVLIILDDVDHRKQLDELAGDFSWFGPGSRIIITTRDRQFLNVDQIKDNNIYEPEGLDHHQSLELFRMHAFGRRVQPPEDYMCLSEEVVRYASGLPLTLEVLGASLRGAERKEWRSALKKLNTCPPPEVYEKLKISYDGLDDTQKTIFLDTACFFIGVDKELAVAIWKGSDFQPVEELRVLSRKFLIKIDNQKQLWMHDQLREMGRQIVLKENPSKPWELSRLWTQAQVEQLQEQRAREMETQKVQGICPHSGWNCNSFRTEHFESMYNLRLLQVNGVNLEGDLDQLSSRLRWLRWQEYPLQLINFYLKRLVVLDLSHSRIIQAWNRELQGKRFEKLKVLDLSRCSYLVNSPDFSGFPWLKRLILRKCNELVYLHESIGQLRKLVHLDLTECIHLKELPCSICRLHSLKELILTNCQLLERLPELIGDLKSLEKLHLNSTRICELPNSIGMLSTLRDLSLEDCRALETISNFIGGMKSLVELYLDNTYIKEIPDTVGLLEKLQKLSIQRCRFLKALPKLSPSLICLKASDCSSLEKLPDLSNLKNLQTLWLANCEKLLEIPGLERAESLELDLTGCFRLPDEWKREEEGRWGHMQSLKGLWRRMSRS